MKKTILLFLTLTLILGLLLSCDKGDTNDTSDTTESDIMSSETNAETTVETFEETSAIISEANEETSTETTAPDESSETTSDMTSDDIKCWFDSYSDFEEALFDESDYNPMVALCSTYPALEMILDYVRVDGNLKQPLVNGAPMDIVGLYLLAYSGHPDYPSYFGPAFAYRLRNDSGEWLADIDVHYLCVEEFYHKDYSSYESAMDIRKERVKNFDPDMWEEKDMVIGGATVTVIEYKNAESSDERLIEYYKDGLYVSINGKSDTITDAFLQSFSME